MLLVLYIMFAYNFILEHMYIWWLGAYELNYGLHVTKPHVNMEDESDSVNFDDVAIDSVDEA